MNEEIDKSEGATEKVVLEGDEESEEIFDGPSDDVERHIGDAQDDLEEADDSA